MTGRTLTSALLLLLALVGGTGCQRFPGQPRPDQRFVRPDQVLDFRQLYGMHCAGCHGADGQFGPAPPLNDALFLAIVPDDSLRQVIERGRKGTPMAPFAHEHGGDLTLHQVEAIVKGMRAAWSGPNRFKQPLPAYRIADAELIPGAADGNRDAGARTFALACAGCHGADGQGGTVGAVNDPALLSLLSDQAIRRIIITGRADLGMPDYQSPKGRSPEFKGPLTEKDIADLVTLLASWRKAHTAGSGAPGTVGNKPG